MVYTLKVEKLFKEAHDVITIYFKQPALKKIRYKSGQYLTIIVRINGRKYIRPYSFSSAPKIDPFLAITVKRIPNGIVSNYLYDHINPGDLVEVMHPLGDFVYDPEIDLSDHIMLWGAGSGITPLMSIIKTALNNPQKPKITLFYSNKNPEHSIFGSELAVLSELHAHKFSIWNFYTSKPHDGYFEDQVTGRINEEKINSITSEMELVNARHYICGPLLLKQTVKSLLLRFKTPETKIHTEDFDVRIDSEQLDDIETRVVKIIKGNVEFKVEVTKGKTILEAGLDHGIDLEYSCQTGTCTLCKAEILNGKIKVIGVDTLPNNLLDNQCLLCCSYPLTGNIQVTV